MLYSELRRGGAVRVGQYLFKRADSDDEFEQIHRLNYRTFVEEVPQYAPSGSGRLVDKFHHKSIYFVALRGGVLAGMVSVHGEPPFSVATRLSDPSILVRAGCRPMKVRLLAVEPRERSGNVLIGLLWMCLEHAREDGYTDVFISGVVDRVEMYRRIGFEPLGPSVPCGSTSFVPMCCTFPLDERVEKLIHMCVGRLARLAARDSDQQTG